MLIYAKIDPKKQNLIISVKFLYPKKKIHMNVKFHGNILLHKEIRSFNFLHNIKQSTKKVHFLDHLFLFTPI